MKYICLLFSFLFFYVLSKAQDTIVQKNGSRIAAKVLEIDKSDVKYKKFENAEGPSYVIPKTDVSLIRYQNGSVDSFNVAVAAVPRAVVTKAPLSEMYLKGQQDAKTYYKNYKPAANWTFGLTLPLNAVGVIPAVIFSATPPAMENLGYPDASLIKDPEYLHGYLAGAKDKKGSHVMKSFGIGAVASFLMYGILMVTVINK